MPSTQRTDKELIDLLVRCRAERCLSLAKVARAVKLSPRAISKIERGETVVPRRTTRLRIVQFLNKHGYFPRDAAA